MFRFLSICACMLFALLIITSASFAQDWILEWYVLDPILSVTNEITNTHQLTYGDNVNADLTLPGGVPQPGDEGTYTAGGQDFEVGEWKVRDYDLGILGQWENVAQGLYKNEFGAIDNFVIHAMVAIISPIEQDVVFQLGYDNNTMVYLNGEDVVYKSGWTDPMVTVPIEVHLNKGQNILMLQVHDSGGGDHMEGYFEVDNLQFSADFSGGGESVSSEGKLASTWGSVKSLR